MRLFLIVSVLSAIGFAGLAHAGDSTELTTTDVHVIVAQQQNLRGLVQDEIGRFDNLSDPERREFLGRQSDLLDLLEGYDTIEELSMEDRIKVFNSLEWIKATVNNEPATEIVVCQQRRRTGSHIRKVDCMTAFEAQRMREAADAFFRNAGIGNNIPAAGAF